MRNKKVYWSRCFWTGHAWYRHLSFNMWECGDCALVAWRSTSALGDPRSLLTRSRTRRMGESWWRGFREQLAEDERRFHEVVSRLGGKDLDV